MLEYEISNHNKLLGKVVVYKNNIKDNLINSILRTDNNFKIIKLDDNSKQKYIISINVNSNDELYDEVSKYYSGDIYLEIENIKKYNKIKNIKKNTKLDIIVDMNKLYLFSKSLKDINLDSLIDSKLYFIDNVINVNNINDISDKYNFIKSSYLDKKNGSTYEFLLEEEKVHILNEYINKLDEVINYIENNTNYKYGRDFVVPIRVD